MGFINDVHLGMRAAKRLGAFKRALKQGMSSEQARNYSDQLYPPTPDDIAYEQRLGRGEGVPWLSALSLCYPIFAALYIASHARASAPLVVGYGLANLGYLLFAAGIFAGHFYVFRLTERWQVLVLALVSFGLGTVLSNLGTL